MDTPGVGYLVEDGSNLVTKVRAEFVSDDQLRWLAENYPSPTREDLADLAPVQSAKAPQDRPRRRSQAKDEEAS